MQLLPFCGLVVACSAVSLPYPRSIVPTGQAGPIFVVSESNISTLADKVTLQTLAGVVARHSPRIYTIKSASPALKPTSMDQDTTVFWLHDLAEHHGIEFNYTYLSSIHGLLRFFASNVSGFVAYDPNNPSQSTNAALIRCAAGDGLIAAGTSTMIDFLQGTLKLPMVANLSTSTPYGEFNLSKAKLSNRGMVAQPNDGSKSNCMSDYAVFARIPTIEHGNTGRDGFQAVLDNFDRSQLNAAYGWTSCDEHEFTASVTQAGGMVHASDFAYNMAVLSQLPPFTLPPSPEHRLSHQPSRSSPAATDTAPRKAVHTVAFVNSDGDNLQLLQGDWISSTHWNHPQRGQQPSGWSYSPAMAILMPSLLAVSLLKCTYL
jgi:hypothetical protein